ncbi:MAG: HEPN domain-containing protein [Luteitalea sp.]|nr:HEPN domain-containing protein [Luteitalea sp.]
MTNASLAQSYLRKAQVRLTALQVLFDAAAYSDVVREAQEIVELALKGMLRHVGVEPPHWHDVGELLKQHRDRLPADVTADVDQLASISAWLRKEREFAFYGDIDFIPTEQYGETEAQRAVDDARIAVQRAELVIEPPPTPDPLPDDTPDRGP